MKFKDITDSAELVPTASSDKELTPKQAMFVREYLIDLNATQAAIRAGYSKKTANEQGARLLANVSVAKSVQAAMDERAKSVDLNATYVLKGIQGVIERCLQAEPVLIRDSSGEMIESGEYTFQAGAALKGYELLGKHLKLFTDKVEVDVGGELAKRMKEARERSRR